MVSTPKKIAFLHRFPEDRIRETNAAFPFLRAKGIRVLTFKSFDRLNSWNKFWKSLAWIFYAPSLVIFNNYQVIYCDDSFPIYPLLVKLASPKSRVVIRIGDLHLLYYTSGLIYKFLHFFEVLAWNACDELIAISRYMAVQLRRETTTKVSVVLDPVSPNDFKVTQEHVNSKKSVMFHGLITKNKNLDVLMKAAKELPEINFQILGDGPDFKRIKKIAPKNVFFHGWCSFHVVCRMLEMCDVGVALRSNSPGNEYVVTSPFLQYGIMGKPCLVTKRKVFGDYEWQFSGVDELVEKIKVLIGRPEEGAKLRKYILDNHNAQDIAEEIWTILS